ncbi:glycosyltransferase [Pseudovibrio exalbescens]|uniref:glycosyltransferase n=1 Tax=Pseudovibrio exalbescens TaxID=197461 RepID=UPI0023672675|nr:glycosyltransferase [Pseudovibrio exalbescens]MDD7910885.1 glycosyltransferase [Pseudovibrio exalbescens]
MEKARIMTEINSNDADVTLCITSCGRTELLQRTLNSFLPSHRDSFKRMLVIDDANSTQVKNWLEETHPDVEVILNHPQLGQMKSIDKLYDMVETDFIYHGEDDWLFDGENTIPSCMKVLEAEPNVSVVSVRKLSDLQERFQKNCIRKEVDGVRYALMPLDIHPEWLSFSFNPGLTRLSLWKRYGPYAKHVTEERISIAMKRDGLMVAFLDPGACHHIGDGQHVDDPAQPIRAKTFPQRMKRSVMKRVNRLRRRLGADV